MTVAYWISPGREVIPVSTSHIATVIKYPSRFGVKISYIRKTYKTFGEKLGLEGAARIEIISYLVSKNWIRLRRYTNKYWSVTINSLTQKHRTTLSSWASRILTRGINGFIEEDLYLPVQIVLVKKNKVVSDLTIGQIAKGCLLTQPTNIKDCLKFSLLHSG